MYFEVSKYRILTTHLSGHPLGRHNGGLIGVRYASLAAALRHGRIDLHIYQQFVQYCLWCCHCDRYRTMRSMSINVDLSKVFPEEARSEF